MGPAGLGYDDPRTVVVLIMTLDKDLGRQVDTEMCVT